MSTRELDEHTKSMAGLSRRERGVVLVDAGLVLVYAAGTGAIPPVLELGTESRVLGREVPLGGFAIDAPSVSRLHARIGLRDDGFVITDLGSRNGVIVNGRRVREAPLVDGDIVRIGDALFRFLSEGARAFAEHYAAHPRGLPAPRPLGGAVGGPTLARILEDVVTVARTELSILVQGETGTGKELIARAVHEASGREGIFCTLNCAAMPANLIESELFGHTRGAYTGADRDRSGYLRRAHQGTLMLDEIGDMPLEAQAKLLRVVESREVVPVGAERPIPIDVRFVCATHRDLGALVAEGKFRGDLFARLNGSTLRLPPLRARKEDLLPLVRQFWNETLPGEPRFTFQFMVALAGYDWPYNVRELQTVIRRATAMAQGAPLDTPHVTDPIRKTLEGYGSPATDPAVVTPEASARPSAKDGAPAPRDRAPARDDLVALLTRHRGNVAAVARELGKDRAQIHRWLHQHALSPDTFRS
jgi:DNA-binding NtrC family response regulator